VRSPINLLALCFAALLGASLVLGPAGEAAGPEDDSVLPEWVPGVGDSGGGAAGPIDLPLPDAAPPDTTAVQREPAEPSTPVQDVDGGEATALPENLPVPDVSNAKNEPAVENALGQGAKRTGQTNAVDLDEVLDDVVSEAAPDDLPDVVGDLLDDDSTRGAAGVEPTDFAPTPSPRFADEAPPMSTGGPPELGTPQNDGPQTGAAILEPIEQTVGLFPPPAPLTELANEDPGEPSALADGGSFMGAGNPMMDAAIVSTLDPGPAQPARDALVAFSSGFLGRGLHDSDGEWPSASGSDASSGMLGGFLGGLR
jgi:hypothetical protein